MPGRVVGEQPSARVSELYVKGVPRPDAVVERKASTDEGHFEVFACAGENSLTTVVVLLPSLRA